MVSEAKPAAGQGPVRRREGVTSDPVASTLLVGILLMLIVLLGAVGSLVWYTTVQNKAPRSEAERNLVRAEAETKRNPKDYKNWGLLALAQANMGRFADAEASIASGRKVADNGTLAVVYADIARLKGDLGEAIYRYEAAKKKAVAEYAARKAELEAKGVLATEPNRALIEATVGQGQVYLAGGRYKEAKAQFDAALKLEPRMADVLVQRGDVEAKLGDEAAAKKDYETALRFVPQMPAALKGLQSLGKGQ